MTHVLHQFLCHHILIHLNLHKIVTSLKLFTKVHVVANLHIPLILLFPMVTYSKHHAMFDEIHVLEENHTCDLVDLPKGKK